MILLRILWLPFSATKKMMESSRLGSSEFDRQTARIWKTVAIVGTVLVFLALAIVGFWFKSNFS